MISFISKQISCECGYEGSLSCHQKQIDKKEIPVDSCSYTNGHGFVMVGEF